MNNFWAIIPARYGSTRFVGKPLAQIDGLPMIIHVLNNVSKVKSKTSMWLLMTVVFTM